MRIRESREVSLLDWSSVTETLRRFHGRRGWWGILIELAIGRFGSSSPLAFGFVVPSDRILEEEHACPEPSLATRSSVEIGPTPYRSRFNR